jgi:hypothetical protein
MRLQLQGQKKKKKIYHTVLYNLRDVHTIMTRPQLRVQIIRNGTSRQRSLVAQLGTPVNGQLDQRGRLKLTRARYPIYDAPDRRQTTKLRGPSPSTTGREERTKNQTKLGKNTHRTEFLPAYPSMANHSQSGTLTKKYTRTSLQSRIHQNGAISNPNTDQINKVRETLVATLNHGRRVSGTLALNSLYEEPKQNFYWARPKQNFLTFLAGCW